MAAVGLADCTGSAIAMRWMVVLRSISSTSSLAPVLLFRRRLKSVARHGVSCGVTCETVTQFLSSHEPDGALPSAASSWRLNPPLTTASDPLPP